VAQNVTQKFGKTAGMNLILALELIFNVMSSHTTWG
jgi:hypothetical protein